MKSLGIVRKLDNLGRVVIPMEVRRTLGIKEFDPVEIFLDGDQNIVLKKYRPGCMSCGHVEKNLKEVNGIRLCEDCLKKFTE